MRKLLITSFALALAFNVLLQSQSALAAPLSTLADYMSNIKRNTASNHDLRWRTPTGMSSGDIVLDFDTGGFTTTGIVFGDVDLFYGSSNDATTGVAGNCTVSCESATLAASAGADAWGVGNATNTITLSYPTSGGTAIAANDYVRVKIGTNAAGPGTNQITNPDSTGAKTINITSGADLGQVSIVLVTNNQLAVGATVDPTLSFSMSANAIGFGHFTSTNVRYATADLNGATSEPAADQPVKLQAGTNAANGIDIRIYDTGNGAGAAGLYSAETGDLIPATGADAISNGQKKYGIYAKNASNITISDKFDNDGGTPDNAITTDIYGDSDTTLLASTDQQVDAATVDLVAKAAITASTKAGIYADTVTIVCTGKF